MSPSKEFDYSKYLFYAVVFLVLITVSLVFGMYSAHRKTPLFRFFEARKMEIDLVLKEFNTLAKIEPSYFLQPARYPGSGVTINKLDRQDDLVLLAGFFDNDNGVRLIRRDGTIVAQWSVRYLDIIKDKGAIPNPPTTNWNTDIHGIVASPDGSVTFNFEYAGMVKMDRCGRVLWTLNEPTNHSLEIAEDGNYWVPSRQFHTREEPIAYPPFGNPTNEDFLLKVSPEGKVLKRISVVKLFYDNGEEAWLTANGSHFAPWKDDFAPWENDTEIVHLNKISELPISLADKFTRFKPGDLLLSLRDHNALVVVDPNALTIKWIKIGPWIRQHDPEFTANGKISVFNNNTYHTAFGPDNPYDRSPPDYPRVSNIMEINPETLETAVVYGNRPGQEFLSIVRGNHDLTASGNIMITEFEDGRAFEVTRKGEIVWQYINRYDAETVAEITEARVYSSGYFTVDNWQCPASK